MIRRDPAESFIVDLEDADRELVLRGELALVEQKSWMSAEIIPSRKVKPGDIITDKNLRRCFKVVSVSGWNKPRARNKKFVHIQTKICPTAAKIGQVEFLIHRSQLIRKVSTTCWPIS